MILIQAFIICICIFSLQNRNEIALFLPPVYLNLLLFSLFFYSLQAGKEALISKFARVVFFETDPDILLYTRRVTKAWAVFFFGMAVEGLVLPFTTTLQTWSLFMNILNYLFIAIFFIIEFIYRRLNFTQKLSLIESLQLIKSADYKQLFR